MRVLVLGGTAAARELTGQLAGDPRFDVETSLAGVTAAPATSGPTRVGGFGGPDALADYLRDGGFGALVDATHPFAATITAHAADAAAGTGVALLVVRPPGWTAGVGDDWLRVATFADAAADLRARAPQTVFLSIGRRELAAFAGIDKHHFLLRMIEAPGPSDELPARRTVLLDRGPFELAAERTLFTDHGVDLLVTKDSGGPTTYPKLAAARELGRPVLMIDRPPRPDGGAVVDSVAGAVGWLGALSPSR